MINWHRVKELQDEVGMDDFREVSDLFLEEVEEVIERLATGSPDFEADFHFLKGSALNLGFDKFAALCAEAERKAAAGQPVDAEASSAAELYAASKQQFLSRLDADSAA